MNNKQDKYKTDTNKNEKNTYLLSYLLTYLLYLLTYLTYFTYST